MNKRNISRTGNASRAGVLERQGAHHHRAMGRRIAETDVETFQPHEDFVPKFRTQAELDAWWDAQPKVRAEVDPRLLVKVKTSIRLSKMTIDGYDYLAKQMGLRSGQTLMKIVLGNYLAQSLPPDF
jgi:hypothetical protein